MEQEYAKKIHRRVTIAAFGLLALVIVFLVYCGMTEAPQIWFHAAVALFLIVFWTLTVVVEPRLLKALDDRTQEQKSAYYKYAVLWRQSAMWGWPGLCFIWARRTAQEYTEERFSC